MKIIDRNIVIKRQGAGHGFTYVATANFTVYSCYVSPNKGIEDLETVLLEIEGLLRLHGEPAIIVGDFNAKSPQWGMNHTDKRGEAVADWIAENDLVIVNTGVKPTFHRREYSSILDLTLCTADIRNYISGWEVSDRESLSDHSYIMFDILPRKQGPKQAKCRDKGWQIRKLDRQALQREVTDISDTASEVSAKAFSQKLTQICNKTMPRRGRQSGGRQPVYWWSDEIAELRRKCIEKRRQLTRNSKKNLPQINQQLWEEYKGSKRVLRNKICEAKRASWKALCSQVDQDIWGDGYKIVMKRALGNPPKQQMPMQTVEAVVRHLFPEHEAVQWACNKDAVFADFTADELRLACAKLKDRKAPGPGNIPPEIIKYLAITRPSYVLSVYNNLACRGNFPKDWKRARLVLLRKGDKPVDSPTSYRPVCLLDVEGKLYEQMLLGRLKGELARTGDLAERQYGFRQGRQTVDAINEVVRIAREAAHHRKLCAAVTLDVRNAFNSASWQMILEELRKRRIDEGIINVVASYLSEREIVLEAEGESKTHSVSSGVPQGSVMGPTLWNVLYDELLQMDLPEGATLVGFADDVALVVTAREENLLMNVADIALQRVSNWMETKRLQLAPEKTEAVLLTTKRKIAPIQFTLQGTSVTPSSAIKYLGVWLDTKLTFAPHVNETVKKAERTVVALTNLMPNVGGPKSSKRRILASVAISQILYAIPVWHSVTDNKKLKNRLSRIQRMMSIRVCSAYRTISAEAVCVIAGTPPIELLIKERVEKYGGEDRNIARSNLLTRWQEMWTSGTFGRWTYRLIPDVKTWINRPFGETDYFLTQALSGHGCFRKYLYDRYRAAEDTCTYCEDVDDVDHTLFSCARWSAIREQYAHETGREFDAENMMQDLTSSERTWRLSYKVIRHIIETKERESR